MDIHHLRVFLSVFKNRSFTRASDELHLSQPTVSDHIKALEEELNCRLFDRLNRKIIPTKEAMSVIGRAHEIVEKADGFRDILKELRNDLAGHIVIGASTIPGTYILPGITSSFRKRHNSVLFEIIVSDSKDIISMIAEHELLIGIVGARLAVRHLNFEPFLEDDLTVIASNTCDAGKSMNIGELSAFPFVMREEGSGTRREFEKMLDRAGIDPGQLNTVGIFGSTDAVKQAVKEGMGISVISRRSVKDELRCGMLREIRIRDTDMKRNFYIVSHSKRTLPYQYRSFLDYLLSRR